MAPIVVVIPPEYRNLACDSLAGLEVQLIDGASTRQGSVRLGLEALESTMPDQVLIHDAARPVILPGVIGRLLAALSVQRAAIPVLPVVDSLAQEAGGMMGMAADRATLRRVQTPQAFHYADILAAHRAWTGAPSAGDDAQVAQAAGIEVARVEGDEALRKITFESDFAPARPPVRVGNGYDVHALKAGADLWLCGVKIAHSHGLDGHSDADVALHALTDSLLGAIAAEDIGAQFPPGSAEWKGAPSHRFLSHAARLVAEAGYVIGHVDITLICEAPKIAPHREAMRASVAAILGIDSACVSVKATTTEKLGFTGRSEGIAAQATATLIAN